MTNKTEKKCTLCLEIKPLAEFTICIRKKTGKSCISSRCKACCNAANIKRRSENPTYNAEHCKKYHQEHRDIQLQKQRDWRQANLEQERIRNKEWVINNRAKYRASQSDYRNRIIGDGTVTKQVLIDLYNQIQCKYCKEDIPEELRTIDHVVPMAKGGKHTITNLVMACKSCNSMKKDMTVEEFLSRLLRKQNKLLPSVEKK